MSLPCPGVYFPVVSPVRVTHTGDRLNTDSGMILLAACCCTVTKPLSWKDEVDSHAGFTDFPIWELFELQFLLQLGLRKQFAFL